MVCAFIDSIDTAKSWYCSAPVQIHFGLHIDVQKNVHQMEKCSTRAIPTYYIRIRTINSYSASSDN